MKQEYDFSQGKRGAVVPNSKQKITIRLDAEVIEYFKTQVEAAGGGNYQTEINEALKEHIRGKSMAEMLQAVVKQTIKEEIHKAA